MIVGHYDLACRAGDGKGQLSRGINSAEKYFRDGLSAETTRFPGFNDGIGRLAYPRFCKRSAVYINNNKRFTRSVNLLYQFQLPSGQIDMGAIDVFTAGFLLGQIAQGIAAYYDDIHIRFSGQPGGFVNFAGFHPANVPAAIIIRYFNSGTRRLT